jgi:MarR family transcriptional regulator, transcriptional regulator for hemolysin
MSAAVVSETPMTRDNLQYEVAFKLALAARRFRARFAERVKSSTQTEARWSALYHLSREPRGLIQSELAERMGIQGPTLVRLIDALEAQSLVRRCSTPEDRRAKRVMILPAGEKMVA